jgi:predicted phage terminase large subunit-like protein
VGGGSGNRGGGDWHEPLGAHALNWSVIYKRAIQYDGSLLFPERLTAEFLDQARRTQGSYVFANQYQNEIIPSGEQKFKKEWWRYYHDLPEIHYKFAFIDPAISEEETADYTALSVVAVDTDRNWYVILVKRQRINPTEIIDMAFDVQKQFQCMAIGIEEVAFQKSLLHFTHERMLELNTMIPVTGVKRGPDSNKHMRIMSLVPRFEFGSLFLSHACKDLEDEMSFYPRAAHDDCLDSLASIKDVVFYPEKRTRNERPPTNDPNYERWYIQQLASGKNQRHSDAD